MGVLLTRNNRTMNGVRQWSVRVLTVTGIALVVMTGMSATETNEWWVRIWDFPRLQILAISLVTLALLLLAMPGFGHWSAKVALVLALACGFQTWRILPYTSLWPKDVATAKDPG